jgi:hydrogenase maturation protein HypF
VDRRAIAVSGIVQGVGFRPYAYGLASRLRLNGFVRNRAGGVLIEVEGEAHALDRFLAELATEPPPLARIDEIRWSAREPLGDSVFRIEPSDAESSEQIFMSPDVSTCDACVAELFDPRDRRYRYPFLNCTHCGPRLTIVTAAPYDRVRTTMAPFVMCAECRAEYDDPSNRRFHAQPTACARCGPQLELRVPTGRPVATDDPIAVVAEALSRGKVVAVKGLGGYHLACIATDQEAVAELRRRKHREEKPFAIMVRNALDAERFCELSAPEVERLRSPCRPIVLLFRKPGALLAEAVAPGNPWIGVMLPYTPLHHILMGELGGSPLVLTSGNRSDEPIAYQDHDAQERLSGIADLVLGHNRPIHLRCDDSVTRVVAGVGLPVRRSRGDAPRPLELPFPCHKDTLALGGQLKVTFALGSGRHAFLSHHIGDLDDYRAYRAYVEAITHYEQLFDLHPKLLVHDLHPDYASTRYCRERAHAIPSMGIQHHHAHMASCMAENALDHEVIGVTFDGTGFGTDGTIWGGEFLTGGYRDFRRAAYFRPVPMPGGATAIREPWRMAAAYLLDAGAGRSSLQGLAPEPALKTLECMIERRLNSPMTTSAGRLFDAVAALAGVRRSVSFEGQAAMELEWLASAAQPDGIYPFEAANGANSDLMIDARPMILAVAADVHQHVAAAVIARRFHSTLVEIIVQTCTQIRSKTNLDHVVLSGGVFLNVLLTTEVSDRLTSDGFHVYRHRLVPPNDGGLSLGQLAIAAARQSIQGAVDVLGHPGKSG